MAKRILKLSQIRLDGNTQPRAELDESLIAEYTQHYIDKADMPPLSVMFDGASYWLTDGFHRRWAAERAGLDKLPCVVEEGTQQDAQWASYAANIGHGLRRTNADKAKAVKAALKHPNGVNKSDHQIADHCGVSHPMVGKYRSELAATSKVYQSAERTGRDGRTTNTANIGHKTTPPAVDPSAESPADARRLTQPAPLLTKDDGPLAAAETVDTDATTDMDDTDGRDEEAAETDQQERTQDAGHDALSQEHVEYVRGKLNVLYDAWQRFYGTLATPLLWAALLEQHAAETREGA